MMRATKFFMGCVLASTMFMPALSIAADNLTVNGFIDIQYQFARSDNDYWGPGGKNSFRVHEGALYIKKDGEIHTVFIDLPFAHATGQTNDFNFAQEKAQAYIQRNDFYGMNFRFGQFDTIYGFDKNDSADLTFTRSTDNFVKDFLPVTHIGLLTTWVLGDWAIDFLIGNSNQYAENGAGDGSFSTDRDESPELGLKFSWGQEIYNFHLGVLYNGTEGDDFEYADDTIYDLGFGANWGKIRFDLSAAVRQNPKGIKALKSNLPENDDVVGGLVQFGYRFRDDINIHLRYETVENWQIITNTSENDYAVSQASLGATYQWKDPIRLKYDVHYTTVDPGSSPDSHVGQNIALIYSF